MSKSRDRREFEAVYIRSIGRTEGEWERKMLSGLATLVREIMPAAENGDCSYPELAYRLVDGRLEFGENRFQLVRIVASNHSCTQVPDTIVEPAKAKRHGGGTCFFCFDGGDSICITPVL
jgi:hypothetical protein